MSKFKPVLLVQEYKANVSKMKDFEISIKVLKAFRSAEDDMLKCYEKIYRL